MIPTKGGYIKKRKMEAQEGAIGLIIIGLVVLSLLLFSTGRKVKLDFSIPYKEQHKAMIQGD